MEQLVLVRWEKNDRATEEWDKWIYPSYFGFNENKEPCFYGYTFDDLISEKKVHNLMYFDKPETPQTAWDDPNSNQKWQYYRDCVNGLRSYISDLFSALVSAGIAEKKWVNPKFENDVREYRYTLETHNVHKWIMRELGISDTAKTFEEVPEEVVNEKYLKPYEWQSEVIEKIIHENNFIDLSEITR